MCENTDINSSGTTRPNKPFSQSPTGARLYCIFYQNQPKCSLKNHFAEPNQHALTFLYPIFNLQGHILNTDRAQILIVYLTYDQAIPPGNMSCPVGQDAVPSHCYRFYRGPLE